MNLTDKEKNLRLDKKEKEGKTPQGTRVSPSFQVFVKTIYWEFKGS